MTSVYSAAAADAGVMIVVDRGERREATKYNFRIEEL